MEEIIRKLFKGLFFLSKRRAEWMYTYDEYIYDTPEWSRENHWPIENRTKLHRWYYKPIRKANQDKICFSPAKNSINVAMIKCAQTLVCRCAFMRKKDEAGTKSRSARYGAEEKTLPTTFFLTESSTKNKSNCFHSETLRATFGRFNQVESVRH